MKKPSFKVMVQITDDMREYLETSVDCQYWAETRWTGNNVLQVREHNLEMDAKPGPWISLTNKRRQRGYELLFKEYPHIAMQLLKEQPGVDAGDGDVWLQLAILGHVKYG